VVLLCNPSLLMDQMKSSNHGRQGKLCLGRNIYNVILVFFKIITVIGFTCAAK